MKVTQHLMEELASIRTGRASVALVEGITVQVYGSDQGLKSVASVTIPDAHTIQIEPWDAGAVKDIERALIEADLGMMPNTAGKIIRLAVPPLTEETRKTLAKMVGKKLEEARIRVRTTRDEIKRSIEKMEKDKEIGEDARYQLQEEMDILVKQVNAELEQLSHEKEEQIMSI